MTLQDAAQLPEETGSRAKVYEQQLLAQSGVSVALLRFMGQLCERLRVAFVCIMQTPLGLRTVVYRRHQSEPTLAVRLLLWGAHAVALVRHDGDTSWRTATADLAELRAVMVVGAVFTYSVGELPSWDKEPAKAGSDVCLDSEAGDDDIHQWMHTAVWGAKTQVVRRSKKKKRQQLESPATTIPPGWTVAMRITAESVRGTRLL